MKISLGYRPLFVLIALIACAGCDAEPPVLAQPEPQLPLLGSATDVSDFEGARAGAAEMGLRALGYEPVRSQGLTTDWKNRVTGSCARIVTGNGRYQSVRMRPADQC